MSSSPTRTTSHSQSRSRSKSKSNNSPISPEWTKSLSLQEEDTACITAQSQNVNASVGQRKVSILSWNTLAQYLFDETPQWYTHVKADAPVSWPERFPRILNEILDRGQADIIALQEVEFEAFENDFQPSLAMLGYDGIMQRNKRKNERTGFGVATFWKRQKFELQHDIHRSRTMATLLRERGDSLSSPGPGPSPSPSPSPTPNTRILALVNCHLEGNPEKSITRVKQLQSILNEISTKFEHHNLVVCGDMNCILGHSACSTYLQKGSFPSQQDNDNSDSRNQEQIQVEEWGRLVQDNKEEGRLQDVPPHSYTMHSAYPTDLAYITYVNRPNTFTCGLDQIWFHDTNSSVNVQVMDPFHSIEHQKQVIENGLPSEYHPSDHMPIGCVLHWTNDIDSEVDLCQRIEQDYDIQTMTATEAQRKARELLDACPFNTTEQRQDFLFVMSEVPGLGKGGKPTAEQIEQIRARRMAKKRLMGEVSDDVRQILEEIIVLMKMKSKT